MVVHIKKKKTNFMAPFYGWGSTASRLEPLQGGSLLFTTKFPEIHGTHFINLRRVKGWVDLEPTQWFWTWDPWIGMIGNMRPLDWYCLAGIPLLSRFLHFLALAHNRGEPNHSYNFWISSFNRINWQCQSITNQSQLTTIF